MTRRRPGAARPDAGHASFAADPLAQLQRIERDGGDGDLHLPGDVALHVTSLDKLYFPDAGYTKGDVMRFYARLAPAVLPAIADRPLVMRRYPEGVRGPSFHQHDPGTHVPPGVRVETVMGERRLVGGDLATLLYSVQLGAIPINAWHSRVGTIDQPDYAVLDLDPDADAGFAGVVKVARLVRAAVERRRLVGVPKTSGSRGVHILIPLPPDTNYTESVGLAEEIAAEVAGEHPNIATVARGIDDRPPGTVYVDYLQNSAGKTLAAVFAVRARPAGTVSTPLTWRQVAPSLDSDAFTIDFVSRRRTALMARWQKAGIPPN